MRAVPAGRRHHRPPDLRRAGLRAGALVSRSAGAKVVLGGLHVLSCPEEVAPHADALAIGEGVQLWPRDPPRRRGGRRCSRVYRGELPHAPIATIRRRAATCCRGDSFLTTTSLIATRGCHNRCGFCYLATDGLHMPYQMRDVEQVVARVPRRRPALRRLHRQQPRLAARLPARALPRRCGRWRRSGAPPSRST